MLKWCEKKSQERKKGRKKAQRKKEKERKKAQKISVSAPLYQMGPVEQRYESTGRLTPHPCRPSLQPPHGVSCVCVCVEGLLAEVVILFIFHSLQPEPCKVLKHKVIILWEITEDKKKQELRYVNTR